MGVGQLPVEQVRAGDQLQAGQRQPIPPAQGLLPVSFRRPEVIGRQHQQQATAVAQHQYVGCGQKGTQVRAASVHIAEHQLKPRGQGRPVLPRQHSREGAQRIAEEPRRQGCLHPAPIGRLRFALPPRQVVLAPPLQQVPAVGHQLQLAAAALEFRGLLQQQSRGMNSSGGGLAQGCAAFPLLPS